MESPDCFPSRRFEETDLHAVAERLQALLASSAAAWSVSGPFPSIGATRLADSAEHMDSAWAQGETAWAQGETAWAQGETAWAQGESVWAQGESVWAQGETAWAQGESAWAQGEPAWAQGEPAWAQGEIARVPFESVWAQGESVWAQGETAWAQGESAWVQGEIAWISARDSARDSALPPIRDIAVNLQRPSSRDHVSLGLAEDLCGVPAMPAMPAMPVEPVEPVEYWPDVWSALVESPMHELQCTYGATPSTCSPFVLDISGNASTPWSDVSPGETSLGDVTDDPEKLVKNESSKVDGSVDLKRLPPRLDDLEAWPCLSLRRAR
jgi:hypothetical protein